MTESPIEVPLPEAAKSAPPEQMTRSASSKEAFERFEREHESADDTRGTAATESMGEPSLRLLADRPIGHPDDDLLGYQPIAEALAAIVLDPDTDTPLTMSISAPWGAGKTSLARLLEHELRERSGRTDSPVPVCIWFNAWTNDSADDLGSAFASSTARQLGPHRSVFARLTNPIPIRMLSGKQRFLRRMLALAGLAATAVGLIAVLWWLGVLDSVPGDEIGPIGAIPGIPVAIGAFLWVWGQVSTLTKTLASYARDPSDDAGRGAVTAVRDEIGRLVHQVTRHGRRGQRIVIFVDDLDRVSPPRPLDVCEVAAQLLDHPGVITVFVADLAAVEAAVEAKYGATVDDYAPHDGRGGGRFGAVFMQKLVQFPVTLPPPPPELIRTVAVSYADQARRAEAQNGSHRKPFARLGRWLRRGLQRVSDSSDTMTFALFTLAFFLILASATFRSFDYALSGTSWRWAWWLATGGLILFWGLLVIGIVARRRDNIRQQTVQHKALQIAYREIGPLVAAGRDPMRFTDRVERTILDELGYEQISTDERGVIRRAIADVAAELVAVDSPARREAEAVVTGHITPLPRSAKRLVNRLRFLLHVAQRNGLLEAGEVSPSDIGKWAVLNDRWPALAWAISLEPSRLGELESLASVDDDSFGQTIASLVTRIDSTSAALREFFVVEPQLGAVAEHLVRLRPPGKEKAPAVA
ncbi:MAG: KAP family NTPase [Acidimicrobiia bacterium]|nr:KAP family NTPase [Acidimicrobiia bacterium]